MNALKDIIKYPTAVEFARSITSERIYKIYNEDFRIGIPLSLNKWNYFTYCLRGSLFYLGNPITESMTVFRGLYIREQDLSKWKDKIGKIVLTPSFTSTSIFRKRANYYGKNCMMEIELIDDFYEFGCHLKVLEIGDRTVLSCKYFFNF